MDILEQEPCNGGVILVFFLWKSWEMLFNGTMNRVIPPRFGRCQSPYHSKPMGGMDILEQELCNGGVILVFFWKSWEMLPNCTMNHMSAPRFGPGQAMMIGRLGVRPYS
jgi:hypothetical protein